jgi:hypothetical protein
MLVPLQNEFLKDFAKLIQFIHEQGWIATGGELWRTKEQQQVYFTTGKSKTMNSNHLKRLAIDLNIFKVREDGTPQLAYEKDELQEFGDYWESLSPHNSWSGNWQPRADGWAETSHFEKREIPRHD